MNKSFYYDLKNKSDIINNFWDILGSTVCVYILHTYIHTYTHILH